MTRVFLPCIPTRRPSRTKHRNSRSGRKCCHLRSTRCASSFPASCTSWMSCAARSLLRRSKTTYMAVRWCARNVTHRTITHTTSCALVHARVPHVRTQVASCGLLQLSLGATVPPKAWIACSTSAITESYEATCTARGDSWSLRTQTTTQAPQGCPPPLRLMTMASRRRPEQLVLETVEAKC